VDVKVKIGYIFGKGFCAIGMRGIVRRCGKTIVGLGMGALTVEAIDWRTLEGLIEEELVQGIG